MTGKSWANAGFWLMLGLAGGMLINDLVQVQVVNAAGSTSFYEDYRIVSGDRNDTGVDVVYLLDARAGKLICVMLHQQRFTLNGLAELDLLEQFDMPAGGRNKPHFMMITGRCAPKGTDACYIAETTTGQLLCVFPPFVSGRPAYTQPGKMLVADRFNFRTKEVRRN